MIQESLQRLQHYCDTIPGLISQISDDNITYKPTPSKWSKQEILGHLVVSATNNHHRFIKAQFEPLVIIPYAQDEWNEVSHFNDMHRAHVTNFWAMYNQHLVELLKRMPADALQTTCTLGKKSVTLQWLIEDYVWHMEHHLRQIVGAENVLASPPYLYE